MKISKNEHNVERREKMRGGDGAAQLALVPGEHLPPHARLSGFITLGSGSSIGAHAHEGETEVFTFISGQGRVDDGGEMVDVAPGDVIITGGGASHAVINTGEDDLVFHAYIVTEA